LERIVQRKEDPIENHLVVETREELLDSPSVAAFNESFGTSYRGELLSVSRKMAVWEVVRLSFCYCGIRLNSWMTQDEICSNEDASIAQQDSLRFGEATFFLFEENFYDF
jgi:hypothetical protein